MTDKQKIKKEIERLKHNTPNAYDLSRFMLLEEIESFIDSLPEEPVSEGIENELERFAYSLPHSADGFWPKDIDPKSVEARTKYGVHHAWSYEQVKKIARHFAEWQKQQMMKDAVDAIVHKGLYSKYIKEQDSDALSKALEGYNPCDKVKIIIIREEEK